MKEEKVPQNVLESLDFTAKPDSMLEQMEKELISINTQGQTEETDGIAIRTLRDSKEVGMAALAAENGYQVILAVPDNMDDEKKLLVDTYGSRFILMNGEDAMKKAVEKAKELSGQEGMKDKVVIIMFPDSEMEETRSNDMTE